MTKKTESSAKQFPTGAAMLRKPFVISTGATRRNLRTTGSLAGFLQPSQRVASPQQDGGSASGGKNAPRDDKIKSLLDWGRRELANLGTDEAQASAERLLEAIVEHERTALYLNAEECVSKTQAANFCRLILKRKARVPVAYLLQKAHFWEEVLEVRPGCLIPRPETEILIDSWIVHSGFRKDSFFSFLDLGAGTGAIGIALLRHFPNAQGTFSDISEIALSVTRRNLKKYELLGRAEIVCSDLFEQLHPARPWDAIVSNPPYVATKDLTNLEPELKFEPAIALDGGKDGLLFYRQIIRQAQHFLAPNGWLVLEMGAGQSPEIAPLISQHGYTQKKICKDYLGIERVIMARVALKAD